MAVSAAAVYASQKLAQQQPLQSLPSLPSAAVPTSDAHTPTALGRWSLLNRKLPDVSTVRSLNVYDFDNTLFRTPLPNTKLWSNPAIGFLNSQDALSTGGWWHDVRILQATGQGMDKEEPRAWEGWWNEVVVDLARLSLQQPDALNILLTGRAETGFGDVIQRMVTSKKLDFDMVVLKPAVGPQNERFSSTMDFKQAFLTTLMETYADATEIRIYEDRPKHVQGFRDFLADYNKRHPIAGEVVHVTEMTSMLDPVAEVAEVQYMIDGHNAALDNGTAKNGSISRRGRLAISKTVFFTGYLIQEDDSKRLLGLLSLPPHLAERDVRRHANSILICPHACSAHLLTKVGGMGKKVAWEVEAVGSMDNSVWAAKVRPVQPQETIHTDGPRPVVVLAVARGARAHLANRIHRWQPVARENAFVFETTVGEKALLRIEPEGSVDSAGSGGSANGNAPATSKRKYPGAHYGNGPIPTQPAAFSQGGRGGFHYPANGRGGRGGGGGGAGRGFGTTGRGGYRGGGFQRGRGGGPGKTGGWPQQPHGPRAFYQSLDDAGGNGGGNEPMQYDEQPQ